MGDIHCALVLLPEALPGSIAGLTITFLSLTGYSARAGAIGGIGWATWAFLLLNE